MTHKEKRENRKPNKYLSQKQSIFVDELLKGKTQGEAYKIAYPRSVNWTPNAVGVAACQLMDVPTIKNKLKELGYQNRAEVQWTRKKALETINYVMDMNRADMERISEAYERERQEAEAELVRLAELMTIENIDKNKVVQEMKKVNEKIARLDKERRTNSTNIKGIFEGAKILNRMFGFDITKVEVKNVDEDKEELNKLNAEELKAILAQVGDN